MKEGKIKPKRGAIEEYDNAVQAVDDIQSEAEQYLREVSRQLGTRAVYFGTAKNRFQIEVPEKLKVPNKFEMSSRRKGFQRYYSKESKVRRGVLFVDIIEFWYFHPLKFNVIKYVLNQQEFLTSIMRAETERDEILSDITRKVFEKFDTQ